MPEPSEDAFLELSSNLTVSEISPGAQQLYGLERGAVLGQPLGEVLLTDAGSIDWVAHWRAVAAGQPFAQVMLHRSASGLRLWVHARLTPPGFGANAATAGTSARLSVRAASGREVLEQQPGGLTRAIGRMLAVGGVGLWMDDRISDEFDWSALARSLHDIAPDAELSPALLFGQIHPDDRAQAAAEIQRGIAERIPYDGVLRIKHGEQGYRPLHVFGGSTYDAQGLALLSVGGVRDLSEEQALRRRVSELEEQLRAAQRGDVVGRLAGGIAHDFNNILTGILGCCEMLTDKLAPQEQSDVEQIRAATLRAADLTRQLLAFGRRQALQRRAVSPAAVLRDVVGLLRRTLPENVEMQLDTGECQGRVLVDVTQLHQVITNLVVNAAQALPEGGRIEISAAQLGLPEELAGSRALGTAGAEYIRFAVEDSGPGVPSELSARIFEPFFSTKAAGQGSGLGLSVVQGIVEQHQGRICVGSGALGGARFEVYLPSTEQAPEVASEPPVRAAELPTSLRVMLVEDEKMVRELTKRILVGAGFQVTEAADAEEALPRIEQGGFDVLLSDVVLRSMSGPELVRRLRERGSELPVVYMSGYPADFVESRVQLGESEVLVHKPFTAATLISALRRRAAR